MRFDVNIDMDTVKRLAIPVTIAIIVIILIALGGLFLYLHQKQAAIDDAVAGRGLGQETATGFPVGSAYSNVVGTIESIFGGSNGNATGTPSGTAESPRLWQVAAAPVAGISWTDDASATSSVRVQFMDQASGNLFEADPATSVVTRRTNTLVPKIARATWTGTGVVLAQYRDEQGTETFEGTIAASVATTSLGASAAAALEAAGPGTLRATALPRGISAIAADSRTNGDQIFYLDAYNGGIAGWLAKDDGSKATRIWTSPLSGWMAAWAGDHLVLTQKASDGVPGTAYDLALTGAVSSLVNSQPGLSVLENPKTGAVLYSTVSPHAAPRLLVQAKSGAVQSLPFSTFAEKCVWSTISSSIVYCAVPNALPAAALPDAWYRGEVHFSDAWWQYDTASGIVSKLYDPATDSRSLDILDPVMSADGAYIAFIDGTTGTAWTLRVNP